MMESDELDDRISNLWEMTDSAIDGSCTWGDVWSEIRELGGAFKLVRYSSRDEKNGAWERFQQAVQSVKDRQRHHQIDRESRSRMHAEAILSHARLARSSYSESLIDALIPSLFPIRERLQSASAEMKHAWSEFADRKGEMLGRDKQETFAELEEIRDGLNVAWSAFKDAQQERGDAHRARKQANREKNERWLGDLYEQLAKSEANRDKCQDNVSSARNDDFRDRWERFLSEAEDRVATIRGKITMVEGWLRDDGD